MGKLYVVPTPIGNLEDITLRALRILKSVDFVLAEDTRTSSILFQHYEINTPLKSYHIFNEHKTVEKFVTLVSQSLHGVALISDAGTPSISDPGFLLVRECIAAEVAIEALPGCTALIPALVNSGLPSDKFIFEGFLPHKKGRQQRLSDLKDESRTIIFYESPFRIIKLLEELSFHFGVERQVSISRELTKKFEETRRGTIGELLSYFTQHPPKGEFVIVMQGLLK